MYKLPVSCLRQVNLSVEKIEDRHGNETKEKDNKKMASYICDWIGKEGRNDLGSLTW